MHFEWDEEKARANIRKHRVDFDTATRVFFDPHRIERYDTGHADDEDRWITIGMVDPLILVVTYAERGISAGSIRLISARKANQYEQKTYYNANT